MKSSLSAIGGALKLGFFVSGLTIASLAARFATADTGPTRAEQADVRALAARLNGQLSDDSLRGLLDSQNRPLFDRFDPLRRSAPELSAVHPFEGPAPNLHLFGLSTTAAQTVNASEPFSLDPNPPARPFAFAGSAEDRKLALTCLTQAVYYEAGFEPGAGQQAVAQVVLNRVRHPIFPHSVCGVVYQGAALKTGCQFSFTCDGSLQRTPQAQAWDRARTVAEQALNGFVMKDVGGATHYHTQWVVPWWRPTVSKVAQVGAHIFYRWPGALGMPGAFSMRYAGNEHIAATPGSPALDDPDSLASRGADARPHLVLAVADATLAEADVRLASAQPSSDATGAAPSTGNTSGPASPSIAIAADLKPAAVPELKLNQQHSYFGKPSW